MKLSNIVISNLATFPYIKDLHNAPGVSFPTSEKYNISIFIGPNGSGKSTFLEIVQQINKTVLFLPYRADLSRLESLSDSQTQELIRLKKVPIHNLYENARGEGKPSIVFLTYMLNDEDRRNLQFVYDHQEQINGLIAKYSSVPVRFNYKNIGQYIQSYEQIVCKVQIDTLTGQAWLLDQNIEDIERFIFDFFTHFYLLQHCIAIHNALYPEPENHWHSLHATMAFIGAYRDLVNFSDTYSMGLDPHDRFLGVVDDIEKSTIKTSQDHLVGFLYMKKKVLKHLIKNHPHASSQEELNAALEDLDMFKSFKTFCIKYLKRRPIIKRVPDQKATYQFLFVDEEGRETLLNMLSAGEKSIMGIILAVYGFDLQEGLLVIEEPELHLHPQLQTRILDFLEEIAQKFGLQCIMTTHSALMINENNIRYVYRFSTSDNVTQIVTPGKHYNEESGKLMQILKFTNTAKLFFAKKIIMVEGETDEYAFGFYLHYLANKNSYWSHILQDYEIVNINGKGGYTRWKKFMRTFGIKSYFIGDWDNVQEVSGIQLDIRRYTALATRRSRRGYLSKAEKYQAIIAYLKKFEPFQWDNIKTMIENLYHKDVFVLQQGEIETYLGMQEKGLEETVSFFQNNFQTWLQDKNYDDKRTELEGIFKIIFEGK